MNGALIILTVLLAFYLPFLCKAQLAQCDGTNDGNCTDYCTFSNATNCFECSQNPVCGWCVASTHNDGGCHAGDEYEAFIIICVQDDNRDWWEHPDGGNCNDPCSIWGPCRDCRRDIRCGWCHDDPGVDGNVNGCHSRQYKPDSCPDWREGDEEVTCETYYPCDEITNCYDCAQTVTNINDPYECAWCNQTKLCVEANETALECPGDDLIDDESLCPDTSKGNKDKENVNEQAIAIAISVVGGCLLLLCIMACVVAILIFVCAITVVVGKMLSTNFMFHELHDETSSEMDDYTYDETSMAEI